MFKYLLSSFIGRNSWNNHRHFPHYVHCRCSAHRCLKGKNILLNHFVNKVQSIRLLNQYCHNIVLELGKLRFLTISYLSLPKFNTDPFEGDGINFCVENENGRQWFNWRGYGLNTLALELYLDL